MKSLISSSSFPVTTKTLHAFEAANQDDCVRWDYCLVFRYDGKANETSWNLGGEVRLFPKQKERRDREMRKKSEKLSMYEHSNRKILPSSILLKTIKKIKRAGLCFRLKLEEDENDSETGLLYLLVGASEERLRQEAQRDLTNVRLPLDKDQVRYVMRKEKNIKLGDIGTITLYIHHCAHPLIYIVDRRLSLKRTLKDMVSTMRMVAEMKAHVRDRHEVMLDKQNRGLVMEQSEEEKKLERRGLHPLDMKSLTIYRVDRDEKKCTLISRHEVQSNFYDWQTYVLSDRARGEPKFEDSENGFELHSNMSAMFSKDDSKNVQKKKKTYNPPSLILQDQVDQFEAPLFGFRRRGTYTLRSCDEKKMQSYTEFDPHLHKNDFYRTFVPNNLLIDDNEDSEKDDVLYTKCRLNCTIFNDITRMKMIRSILENPENQHPRYVFVCVSLSFLYIYTNTQQQQRSGNQPGRNDKEQRT